MITFTVAQYLPSQNSYLFFIKRRTYKSEVLLFVNYYFFAAVKMKAFLSIF